MAIKSKAGIGIFITGLIIVFCLVLVMFKGVWWRTLKDGPIGEYAGPQAVIDNYGSDFRKFGKEFHIAPEYLAALCMLESGGRKPAGFRYEKHVYTRLQLVKLGLRRQYEHVKPADIGNAGDEALQNLATSWGPFQLMGYKCLLYNIYVKDLRSDEGVYWGVKWIKESYGSYLIKGDYKSAFHIHNTGRAFPKNGKSVTHDPKYVQKGLQWMQYFKGKL